jgi:hypothetical protein
MTKTQISPMRRALRALNLFTLVTLNPTSPYDTPYTGQITKVLNGHRVF